MPHEHVIDPTQIHHSWDNGLEPALRIESEDTVHYDLLMCGEGQLDRGMPYSETRLDFDTLYNLSGPVWIEGAHPGDTLEVEILDLRPGAWGWTVVLPELGLLPEDFPDPFIRYFDLSNGSTIDVVPGVKVPIRPFLGTMGTHPDVPATATPFPPHKGGGNVDTRHLTAGVSVFLPVHVEGALFSCGDPHATQGDGEVCVSAVECPMKAALRFRLHRQTTTVPYLITSGPDTTTSDAQGYYGTMGIDPDLMQGAKTALRGMIELLGVRHSLMPDDAYVLCSLVADLRIFEIVDAGVWNVGLTLPRSVFVT